MLAALITIFVLLATGLGAHEMTPTYPELKPSHVPDVLRAELSLLNMRDDVEYYEISVFDGDWNKVPFATANRVIRVKHLERQGFEVYVRKIDEKRAIYVCTTSKLTITSNQATVVSSMICSRMDGVVP